MSEFVKISSSGYNLLANVAQDCFEKERFLDTKIICMHGEVLNLPKFMVGVAFPELRNILHFNLFSSNTIFLPDYSKDQVKSLLGNNDDQKNVTKVASEINDDPILNNDTDDADQIKETKVLDDNTYHKEQADFDFYSAEVEHDLINNEPSRKSGAKGKTKKYYKGEIYPGDYPFKCSYCDKKFKQVGHVNHHERIHTGNFKYSCNLCDKKFYQKSHLLEHENVHTGEKPHQCQECKKRFTFSSGLKAHRNIHTGDRAHQCTLCDKSFGQLSNLKTHMKLHSGSLSFMCSDCGKGCNTKLQLQRHRCKMMKEISVNRIEHFTINNPQHIIDNPVFINDGDSVPFS